MSNFRYTRPDSFPPIVKNLIIINVLVWIAQITLDQSMNLTSKLMLYPLDSPDFSPYQIATYMFAHAPFPAMFHIMFNMFGLYMFGRVLENVWGPKRFLFFYLVCGVGAAACHMAIQHFRYEHAVDLYNAGNVPGAIKIIQSLGPMLGASGAIMGIFAAFAYLFPNTELLLMFFPVPIKAKWLVLIMAGIDLFGGVANFTNDNVAHFAHLGGAITGFIIVLIWNKRNRRRLY